MIKQYLDAEVNQGKIIGNDTVKDAVNDTVILNNPGLSKAKLIVLTAILLFVHFLTYNLVKHLRRFFTNGFFEIIDVRSLGVKTRD